MRLLFAFVLCALALPARASTELKIAAWNIAWLTTKPAGHPALPRDHRPRSRQDFAELQRYAERLAADIVALQEVDGPLAAARVFDARLYDFHFPNETDTQRAGFAFRRSLRVTRNPDLVSLDLNPTARFSLRRGADISVETPGGSRLRLLSIHLDAGCREGSLERPNSKDCANLARQASIIAGWAAERRREGVPFMILGDFNRRMDRRGDHFMEAVAEAAPVLRATEGHRSPCWVRRGRSQPFVDHILLGGAARGWMVPNSLQVLVYEQRDPEFRDRLSDHCPISVTLRLP